jgi:Ser/Thr protein kinase RdoA (MazF antagonist)
LFRLYDWVSVRPLDLASPETPSAIGDLIARMHLNGPALSVEPDGGPPSGWYDRTPDLEWFARTAQSAQPWAARLAERLDNLRQLRAVVALVDPAQTLLCHRDLHPGNVLADESGSPVVLDWDNLGPADPTRELAEALFDWWCDPEPDLAAMRAMYQAYVRSGGPARVTEPVDFSMVLAARLNFLRVQLEAYLDEQIDQQHRDWAAQEIDEALRILPTPEQLTEVLDVIEA